MSRIGASAFKAVFIKRTATARERTGMSQDEMAVALGIGQGTYKNYETNRCLPHQHVATFCRISNIDIEWLYTGRAAKVAHRRKLSA